MTAEIAVMNKLGIALAADSAASIVAGSKVEKIYVADKLFPLCGHAPVGVMVYNNLEFLGVPWETVVGAYRKQLGDKTFDGLSGYAVDFFGFVEDNEVMFPQAMRAEYAGKPQPRDVSGIVFAGYGEDEYMPVCLEYQVAGMARDKLRYRHVERTAMTQQNGGAILPFAQSETAESFLEGVHPHYRKHLTETVEVFLEDSLRLVFGRPGVNIAPARKVEIIKSTTALLEDLFQKWRNESEERHWGPVVDMVEYLPKNELASTAENLVNLTIFRLRIGAERETVGGPIDVALITKGEGFVWVKKKRYYPAELNPRKSTT